MQIDNKMSVQPLYEFKLKHKCDKEEVIYYLKEARKFLERFIDVLNGEGALLLTVPFNFRIHEPLPDCWRFTEHGLRELLKNFSTVKIESIDTPNRDLMPIHYTVIAIKQEGMKLI